MDADASRIARSFAKEIDSISARIDELADDIELYVNRQGNTLPLAYSISMAKTSIAIGRRLKKLNTAIHRNMRIEFENRKIERRHVRHDGVLLNKLIGVDLLFEGKPVAFYSIAKIKSWGRSQYRWSGALYEFPNDGRSDPGCVTKVDTFNYKDSEEEIVKAIEKKARSRIRNLALKHDDWKDKLWPHVQTAPEKAAESS